MRFRPNGKREWRKAEVIPRSYMMEDEYGRIYRRNTRQIISVPNDSPMTPWTRTPPTSTQPHDSFACTRLALVFKKPPPSPVTLERQTETVSQTPVTTRSGCQVRRPQRLIESC